MYKGFFKQRYCLGCLFSTHTLHILYVYVWGIMELIVGHRCHPKWMCSHLGFKALCSLIKGLAAINFGHLVQCISILWIWLSYICFIYIRSAGYWGAAEAFGRAEAESCSRGSVPVGGAPWLSNATQQSLFLNLRTSHAPLHPTPHSALFRGTTVWHPQPGELGQHGHKHLHWKQLCLLSWQHVQVRHFHVLS